MPWNCFIDVCGTAEGCGLRPAIETLRVSITAVWFVELGMSRSGVFNTGGPAENGQRDEDLI